MTTKTRTKPKALTLAEIENLITAAGLTGSRREAEQVRLLAKFGKADQFAAELLNLATLKAEADSAARELTEFDVTVAGKSVDWRNADPARYSPDQRATGQGLLYEATQASARAAQAKRDLVGILDRLRAEPSFIDAACQLVTDELDVLQVAAQRFVEQVHAVAHLQSSANVGGNAGSAGGLLTMVQRFVENQRELCEETRRKHGTQPPATEQDDDTPAKAPRRRGIRGM